MSQFDPAPAITDGRPEIAREVRTALSRLVARINQFGTAWMIRRDTACSLEQLYRATDRELWDMGLSRSDFPAIIKGTYRRD